MRELLIRRPKVVAALAGLAIAVGLTVIPAQADSSTVRERPTSTGTIGHGAAPGGHVTREQIIARAKHWVDERVPYSREHFWKDDATGGRYRQDCSGFVSMAWQLKDSMVTQTLPSVADRISFDQLEPGDALDYPDAHALLFGGWTNKAKGDFFYYSQSNTRIPAHKTNANIHDSRIADHPRGAYVALRYKKLATTQEPAPAPATASAQPPAVPSPPAPDTKPAAPSPITPSKPKPKPKPSTAPSVSPKPTETVVPKPKPSITAAVPSTAPALDAPAPDPSAFPPAVPVPAMLTAAAEAPVDRRPNADAAAPGATCTPVRRTSFRLWTLLPFPFFITF
ncbi:hypothetical protein [Streptomyces sp. Isolate_45]|uniref:hypothetical protein n=1 Tax=Streptomyces sp. Isolate_45 TaxID=2950111 RepID=UPI002481BF57|nr:hypothetical protein [Streptomyces sp. Isolate_45]MDA5283692.1 hypothetical protein [Streptomyces sp. Isolate_45]